MGPGNFHQVSAILGRAIFIKFHQFWPGNFHQYSSSLGRAIFITFHQFWPGNLHQVSSILSRAIFIKFHFGPGNFLHSSILGRALFHQVSSALARQFSSSFINIRPGIFHHVALIFGRAIFIKCHFGPGNFHQASSI